MTDHHTALDTAAARAQEAIAATNALVAARGDKPTAEGFLAELRALADLLTARNDLAKALAAAQGITLAEPEPDPVDTALHDRAMAFIESTKTEGESPDLHAEGAAIIMAQFARLRELFPAAPAETAH